MARARARNNEKARPSETGIARANDKHRVESRSRVSGREVACVSGGEGDFRAVSLSLVNATSSTYVPRDRPCTTDLRGDRENARRVFEGASAHACIAHATSPANRPFLLLRFSFSLSLSFSYLARAIRASRRLSRHRHVSSSRPLAPTSLRRLFNWREILLIELLRVCESKAAAAPAVAVAGKREKVIIQKQ